MKKCMRRAGPLKKKFILQLLAPPPLLSPSPKLSYSCLSTAAAMLQTCQGSSCRSADDDTKHVTLPAPRLSLKTSNSRLPAAPSLGIKTTEGKEREEK